MDQFNSTHTIFRAHNFICTPAQVRKKTGAQNQSQHARLIGKKLETVIFVLCYLNRACSFHFQCNFIKNFYNEAFAMLILFECLE